MSASARSTFARRKSNILASIEHIRSLHGDDAADLILALLPSVEAQSSILGEARLGHNEIMEISIRLMIYLQALSTWPGMKEGHRSFEPSEEEMRLILGMGGRQ